MTDIRKLQEIGLARWQALVEEANDTDGAPHTILHEPLAMRCENTQLTTGWRCGGFTFNGHTYLSLCPRDANGDGAMLAVREDFVKWVAKRIKKEAKR